MHHVIVTRVSLTLSILLLMLVVGFALVVGSPVSPATAEGGAEGSAPKDAAADLYDRYCGACHEVNELVEGLQQAEDPDALVAEWLRFLERHGRASPEQDMEILEYLSDQRKDP